MTLDAFGRHALGDVVVVVVVVLVVEVDVTTGALLGEMLGLVEGSLLGLDDDGLDVGELDGPTEGLELGEVEGACEKEVSNRIFG